MNLCDLIGFTTDSHSFLDFASFKFLVLSFIILREIFTHLTTEYCYYYSALLYCFHILLKIISQMAKKVFYSLETTCWRCFILIDINTYYEPWIVYYFIAVVNLWLNVQLIRFTLLDSNSDRFCIDYTKVYI